ncbi:MAG: 50S ribosomal protein L29 [Microcystaceae cyanobacterium]
MPLPKIEDARKLDDEELAAEILAAKRKLFELRFQQATRRLEKSHEFKHTRHRIAQLMTIERERQLAANQPQPQAAKTAEVLEKPLADQEEE